MLLPNFWNTSPILLISSDASFCEWFGQPVKAHRDMDLMLYGRCDWIGKHPKQKNLLQPAAQKRETPLPLSTTTNKKYNLVDSLFWDSRFILEPGHENTTFKCVNNMQTNTGHNLLLTHIPSSHNKNYAMFDIHQVTGLRQEGSERSESLIQWTPTTTILAERTDWIKSLPPAATQGVCTDDWT